MKAEIILRVEICPQEKTTALWKNFKLKFTLLLLCQQKGFLVEQQISNLKKKKMTEADRRHSWHTLEERKKGPFVNFECIIQLIQVDASFFSSSLPPSWVTQGQLRTQGRFVVPRMQHGRLPCNLRLFNRVLPHCSQAKNVSFSAHTTKYSCSKVIPLLPNL